jgi:myo-inositol-1-phosphate synthase
MGTN